MSTFRGVFLVALYDISNDLLLQTKMYGSRWIIFKEGKLGVVLSLVLMYYRLFLKKLKMPVMNTRGDYKMCLRKWAIELSILDSKVLG